MKHPKPDVDLNALCASGFRKAVFKKIVAASSLFQHGELIRRKDIVARIRKAYLDRGGADDPKLDNQITSVFKKGIRDQDVPFQNDPDDRGMYMFLAKSKETSVPECRHDDWPAEINYGDDNFRCYAWCEWSDAHLNFVKVGVTGKGGLRNRLESSQRTRPPRYLMCVRLATKKDAESMERALHIALSFRGRRVDTGQGQGKDFFNTSLEELKYLVESIHPKLSKWENPDFKYEPE